MKERMGKLLGRINEKGDIILKPIGLARNNVKKPMFGGWDNIITEIILDKDFTETLEGIENYSHIIVVYWMHNVGVCKTTHRPQGREDVPVVGIFACRYPPRPNPIGITTVKLLEHKKNVLKVKGLDVLDGTPILDIKPYTPQYDYIKESVIPDWVNRLEY